MIRETFTRPVYVLKIGPDLTEACAELERALAHVDPGVVVVKVVTDATTGAGTLHERATDAIPFPTGPLAPRELTLSWRAPPSARELRERQRAHARRPVR